MKILLVDNFQFVNDEAKFSGVTYHRMIKPHTVLKRNHGIEFTLCNGITEEIKDDFIKEFNFILFSRSIGNYEDIENICNRLDKLNILYGLDLDDHWILSKNHILTEVYKENKTSEAIFKSIQNAKFVICTTSILADEIKPHNKNVYVIENGIDTEDWKVNKAESERIRFGFTQGSTHFDDLSIISESVVKSLKDGKFYNKAQIVLCGFHAELDKPSIYVGYEKILTNSLNVLLDKAYQTRLKSLIPFEDFRHPYVRMWNKDVFEYSDFYNHIDISVAPLENNKFNRCKSELKMIEAGFSGCAFMGSGHAPYSIVMTSDNSFNLNENSFYYWQRYILNNPNVIKDKASQLSEDVKKYDLKILSEKRKQIYESWFN